MVEITLFELHLDDADLTAYAPFSAVESLDGLDEVGASRFLPGEESEDEPAGVAADGGGGPSPVAVVLALGLVAVAVVALWRLMGGEPEPVPE